MTRASPPATVAVVATSKIDISIKVATTASVAIEVGKVMPMGSFSNDRYTITPSQDAISTDLEDIGELQSRSDRWGGNGTVSPHFRMSLTLSFKSEREELIPKMQL